MISPEVTVPYAPDLNRLLTEGARFTDGQASYVIEAHDLGEAVLPSGQVVACDPLVNPDTEPFTASVPPGRYPVRAWVAVLHRADDGEWQRRVAALQLVIRPDRPVEWRPAVLAGQDPASLIDSDEFFGYPVDAGAGTLADPAALRVLAGWDYDRIERVFITALPVSPVPGAISTAADEETGANVVSVASGWGDGFYPTFVGHTATGEVTSFVTDFLVVPRD